MMQRESCASSERPTGASFAVEILPRCAAGILPRRSTRVDEIPVIARAAHTQTFAIHCHARPNDLGTISRDELAGWPHEGSSEAPRRFSRVWQTSSSDRL